MKKRGKTIVMTPEEFADWLHVAKEMYGAIIPEWPYYKLLEYGRIHVKRSDEEGYSQLVLPLSNTGVG